MGDIINAFENASVLPPATPVSLEEKEEENPFIPNGCPVVPLGKLGDTFYYLDETEELREVKARDHSRLNILSLFGKKGYLLHEYWPRYDKDGDKAGWKPEIAAESLIAAASALGAWSPFARVRGPGGWVGQDGELILHCGDQIIIKEREGKVSSETPGLLEKTVYPRAPAIIPPDDNAVPANGRGPADDLLQILRTWNWKRSDVDPVLLLGWIGAAILGGALKWRPVVWLTGGKGTGKSTLQEVIQYVLGENSLVPAADATAAGVWQAIGYASLPVAIDEAESEEDNRRQNALIKLARVACSGGLVLRGGADHNGAQFTARSAFIFSSILLPPLLPQDRSRMAILELLRLDGGDVPDMTQRKLNKVGASLRRRIIDGWPRFFDTLALYRRTLEDVGHKARGADVFGTLLACADILLFDSLPDSDSLELWGNRLKADNLAELDGDDGDEWECLRWLLSSAFDAYRGGARLPVAEWIRISLDEAQVYDTRENANKALGNVGLRIDTKDQYLLVANVNRNLSTIFERSHWAARSGAQGVWVQALRRLPGAGPRDTVVIGGVKVRATKIPLSLVVGDDAAGVKPGV